MNKFYQKHGNYRTATKSTETSVQNPTLCTYIPNPLCAVVQQLGMDLGCKCIALEVIHLFLSFLCQS